jgi:hypothetical protein
MDQTNSPTTLALTGILPFLLLVSATLTFPVSFGLIADCCKFSARPPAPRASQDTRPRAEPVLAACFASLRKTENNNIKIIYGSHR